MQGHNPNSYVCPRCGRALTVSSWPFCPHGDMRPLRPIDRFLQRNVDPAPKPESYVATGETARERAHRRMLERRERQILPEGETIRGMIEEGR